MSNGFLAGLVSGAADSISSAREKIAKQEELTLTQRRGVLDMMLQGMQQGLVPPEHFARLWADYEALTEAQTGQRKKQKGVAGFMGRTEMPGLSIMDAIARGEFPFMNAPGAQGATGTPSAGVASPRQLPPPPTREDASDPNSFMGGASPSPLTPTLPGTANMTRAAGDLAGDVKATGPQGLWYSPLELGRQKAEIDAAAKGIGRRSDFATLTELLGPERGPATFAASLGYNPASALRGGDDFVGPEGVIAKAAIDPQTQQYVFTQAVTLPNGQQHAPGTPIPPTWQPYERPGVATNERGVVTGYHPVTGQPLWSNDVGRATPSYGFPFPVATPDSPTGYTYYTPSRFGPTAAPTGGGLPAPARPELLDLDPVVADAQQRFKLINDIVRDDIQSAADPTGAKEKVARIFGTTWQQVVVDAGHAPRRRRRLRLQTGDGTQGVPDPEAAVDAYLKTANGKQFIASNGGNAATVRAQLLNDPQRLAAIVAAYSRTQTRR